MRLVAPLKHFKQHRKQQQQHWHFAVGTVDTVTIDNNQINSNGTGVNVSGTLLLDARHGNLLL